MRIGEAHLFLLEAVGSSALALRGGEPLDEAVGERDMLLSVPDAAERVYSPSTPPEPM